MGETEQESYFESKEKFQQQLQDIFQTTLRLTRQDQFDQLCQWMEYKQYLTIDDFYESSYNDPEKFDTKGPATEYKWKGKMNHLSPNVAQKLKSFVRWMTHEDRPYELHDDFLATLTRERYLKFRHMDTLSFSASSPSHHEPSKLKTSFSGESKHQTPSESQTALNNFKKGTKRDASVLDHEITPCLLEDINQHSDDSLLQDSIFDEYGDLHHRAIQTLNIFCDLPSLPPGEPITHAHLHDSNPAEEDWKSLRPYFGWQSEQVIKDTYKVTSRFGGTIPQHDYLKKHFKSRNPVFNIPRRNEPVATDTIFSDTPAVNDGSTMAQFFVGRDTLVCDAYGIKSQKQFINTLYDNIRFRGAMTTLITDGGRYEISKKVADLLRSLFIKQYESEPYHQHQNKAEQRYGVVKRYINTLMNLTGAPAHCWSLCMLYVCNLLNATASPALGGLTPLQALTGQVPDISHFLQFSFWEPVYYKVDEREPDHRFPSQSNEKRGHWVGFADNQGDHLTWKILTDDTNTIIIRSAVRSATKTSPNLRLDPPKGEDQPQDLTSDVFMAGPILMDLITPRPCPSSILMTYWGEPSSYLWMRMGRERGLPFLNMSRISVNNKSQEKISSDSSSRLMETNLMTSFHITNLRNT